MLTRKQKELLLLIRDRLAADGVPPSFDEMKEALGLKSKSGIHRLITALKNGALSSGCASRPCAGNHPYSRRSRAQTRYAQRPC